MAGWRSLEIRDLKYLAASANAGTFSRAADVLGLTTSTVSRRVGQVEDELGLAVFERGHFGVRLTAGGRNLMVHVRRALAELDAVERAGALAGSGEAGLIRLGLRMPLSTDPLGDALATWREQHRAVKLTVSELNDRDLGVALEENRIDVAIMFGHTVPRDMASLPLYREPVLAAVAAGHTLARRTSVGWPDLRHEVVLVQGWDESQAMREFYSSVLGSGARFQAHPASERSILALVSSGFGISLAPASQTEIPLPGMIILPVEEADAWMQFTLVWRPDLEDAVVGSFVAFLRDGIGSNCST